MRDWDGGHKAPLDAHQFRSQDEKRNHESLNLPVSNRSVGEGEGSGAIVLSHFGLVSGWACRGKVHLWSLCPCSIFYVRSLESGVDRAEIGGLAVNLVAKNSGDQVSKAGIVKAWTALQRVAIAAGDGVTGHSARRSGI